MNCSEARVLHISKYYYPFLGGTEQVARDMVNALIGNCADQKVLCFNEDATDGHIFCTGKESKMDIVDGIEIYRCGSLVKIASQALSMTYGKTLKKLMNQFRPNIVIFHYPNPFATYYLLKYRNRNFNLLVYWHLDITKQKTLKRFFRGQNLTLIKRANRILGATPKHVDESEFSSYFGDKKYILPYMIDENNLVLSDEEKRKGEDLRKRYTGKVLGFFIGRHVPYKGLTYLIKASKELGDEKIHFLVAGSGELTDALKNEARDDPKVEFLGRITDSERRSLLYACDIICFPSVTRNEGFGLALAEGMFFGHPAVTFKIPGSGVNYVNLDGITGIECPNSDYKAYADALRLLCRDEEMRTKYGVAAHERILTHFTGEKFRSNLILLIETL